MDTSTTFMDLKYRLGLHGKAAQALIDRATEETVAALGPVGRLYCYWPATGQPRFALVGVTA
jgi:hypothetical protein